MLVFGGVSDVDRGDRLESTFYNDVRGLPALFLPCSCQCTCLRREETPYLSPTDIHHVESNMSSKFPDRIQPTPCLRAIDTAPSHTR